MNLEGSLYALTLASVITKNVRNYAERAKTEISEEFAENWGAKSNMIFVTGDCHGEWHKFSTDSFPEQKELTRND